MTVYDPVSMTSQPCPVSTPSQWRDGLIVCVLPEGACPHYRIVVFSNGETTTFKFEFLFANDDARKELALLASPSPPPPAAAPPRPFPIPTATPS